MHKYIHTHYKIMRMLFKPLNQSSVRTTGRNIRQYRQLRIT